MRVAAGGLLAAVLTIAALALAGCPGRGGADADEPRAEAVPPDLDWPDAAMVGTPLDAGP